METSNLPAIHALRPAWNKGRIVGQKRPLKPKHVWAIRVRLELAENHRDLALFNLAIDSKLRGCVLVKMKVVDVMASGQIKERASVLQSKTQKPVRFEISEGTRCNFRLTGEIGFGDADRFEAFLENHSKDVERDRDIHGRPRIAVLCLDSPGGSLTEAVQIAEQIRYGGAWGDNARPFISTRLERGAKCLSACAVIFLAGTMDDFEGPPGVSRSMDPTARLGFHAPALNIPDGNFDQSIVSDAYNTSIQLIAELMQVLVIGPPSAESEAASSGTWMRASLLERMLQTPHDEMFILETVNHAGQFDITIHPFVAPQPTRENLFFGCVNALAWRNGRASAPYGDGTAIDQPATDNELGLQEDARLIYVIDPLNGVECEAAIYEDNTFQLAPLRYSDRLGWWSNFVLFDPDTPLTDIAVPPSEEITQEPSPELVFRQVQKPSTAADFAAMEAEAIQMGTTWGPRYGGDKVIYFAHNGSGMAWETWNEFLWVWYFRPRDGLETVGVVPGTLLLFSDSIFRTDGVARRFSNRCDDIVYEVSQTAWDGWRLTLQGSYNRLSETCGNGPLREDELIFDYIGLSPDQMIETEDGAAPTNLMKVVGVSNRLNLRELPSSDAAIIDELPANLSEIQLLTCLPRMPIPQWRDGTNQTRRALLDQRWCSLEFNGKIGFVSGRFRSWR